MSLGQLHHVHRLIVYCKQVYKTVQAKAAISHSCNPAHTYGPSYLLNLDSPNCSISSNSDTQIITLTSSWYLSHPFHRKCSFERVLLKISKCVDIVICVFG